MCRMIQRTVNARSYSKHFILGLNLHVKQYVAIEIELGIYQQLLKQSIYIFSNRQNLFCCPYRVFRWAVNATGFMPMAP